MRSLIVPLWILGQAALAGGLGAAAPVAEPQPLSPAAQAVSATVRSLRDGFDEEQPIAIQGGHVVYRQQDEELLAEGEVVLESAGARVHADRLWYDMKHGTLRAEGQVVVAEGGNTLWARRAVLQDLSGTSRSGKAEDLLFKQDPWTAACGEAELLQGDVLLLRGCECSTCDQASPYWRLSAKTLKIKAGERLWAWGVWLHAGRVPVFYLPYYSQSLKDPRPPIEIKPGYSRDLGAYVRTSYNYYLGEGAQGSLRYDWMDKKGSGFGASQHWAFKDGEGEAAGYYSADKNDPEKKDWSANLRHRQGLGYGVSLLANLDLLSNERFNETFDLSQVDTFQRRSFLALQGAVKEWSWSLRASETQVLQSEPDGAGGVARREMVVIERALPALSLNRFSRPWREGSRLYWGVDARAQRSLITPLRLVTATAATLYDPSAAYYEDQIGVNPNLSYTLSLMRGLALSDRVNLDQSWRLVEGGPVGGGSVSAGGNFLNLRWTPLAGGSFDLGWRYRQQWHPQEALPWSGLLDNRLEARSQVEFGELLSLLVTTDYDLRPWKTDNDLKRLGLVRVQASHSASADRSGSLSVGWHAPTSVIKTLDAWLNANEPAQRWQVNLGLNWVNNRIVSALPAVDALAPLELAVQDPRNTPDQLLASLRGTLNLGPRWRLSLFERLDLDKRRIDEQALSLYRDFNCIDLELYGRQTVYGGWQFGFAMSLRSVPNVKVNSNQVTADLFEPIQYGY